MGAFTQYAAEAAMLLASLYVAYRLALAGSSFCRFNRRILLCAYCVAFLAMPILNLPIFRYDAPDELTLEMMRAEMSALTDSKAPVFPSVIAGTYALGVIVATTFTLRSAYGIYRIIKRGKKVEKDGYTLVFSDAPGISPFSWGRYVVAPSSTKDADLPMIVAHECSHLRHHHWADLVIGQAAIVLNWFNPAAYLMMKELQDVHEYEADKDVIAFGIDKRQYRMLLLRNATGCAFPAFADKLSHSRLKTRFRLMDSPGSNPLRKVAATIIPPLVLAVVLAFESPAIASQLSALGSASLFSAERNEVTYDVSDKVHSIKYVCDGMPTSVSMDAEPGSSPRIYINRYIASARDISRLKAEDVEYVIGDNIHNRFIIKTK